MTKVQEVLCGYSSKELARIILYNGDIADVIYSAMNDTCSGIIKRYVSEVDVIDDRLTSNKSGEELYREFCMEMDRRLE
jgi:hypothetical protein